jgi:uncharacterized protein (TIGR00725 family)
MKNKKPYSLCVSGSAIEVDGPESVKRAYELGMAIAQSGNILSNGATTGMPFESARGAKAAGGMVIGWSPAASKREHVGKYKLPLEYLDFTVYTGAGYTGRDMLLVRASDAVFIVSGRIGTLNEFSIAFEDKKPIGVLIGTGGVSDELANILRAAHHPRSHHIVFDSDPERLVKKVVKMLKEEDKESLLINKHNHATGRYKHLGAQTIVPD